MTPPPILFLLPTPSSTSEICRSEYPNFILLIWDIFGYGLIDLKQTSMILSLTTQRYYLTGYNPYMMHLVHVHIQMHLDPSLVDVFHRFYPLSEDNDDYLNHQQGKWTCISKNSCKIRQFTIDSKNTFLWFSESIFSGLGYSPRQGTEIRVTIIKAIIIVDCFIL